MDTLPTTDRSIQIQRDAIGSAIVSGEGNTVFIYQYQLAQAESSKAPKASVPVELTPNPYKGLLAFHETDGDRFFGREKQIEQLWQKLRDVYEDGAKIRLLPIYGPSGSGKSSLARAGLIPELARRPLPGRDRIRVAILVPGSHPLEALAGVLAKIATLDPTPVAKTRELAGEMSQPNSAGKYDGLRRIADMLPDSPTMPLLILVDQFEETYTLCQDQTERDIFVENLLCAASDKSRRVSVVITLRSDFLGQTQKHPILNQLFSSQGFLVPSMSEEELCEAIRKPAELAGHPLDEATISLLLEQAEGREGALPLLQFALSQIWEGIVAGVAPAVTLERIGGVGGALAGEAQRVFDSLRPEEQVIARRVFLGAVQLGEGARDTRRRVAVDNLTSYKDDSAQVRKVVERFSDPGVRLIMLGANEYGQETVEVSHEALFAHWQLLDRWLEESRSDLRFQRRLEAAAQYWEKNGCPDGSLWRSPDLELLRQYVARSGDDMTPLQLSFFKASVRSKQHGTLVRWAAVSSLVILTGFTSWQMWNARRGETRAFAQQLAIQSESIGTSNPSLYQTSALLAVGAKRQFDRLGEDLIELDRSLRSALFFLPQILQTLKHEDQVYAVQFSPDGTKVATASLDKTARIWDTATGKELARLNHDDRVAAIVFSLDGTKVATASFDKTARIWDTTTGQELWRLNHDSGVGSVSFSLDGTKVVTGSLDRTARIWNTVTGEELVRLIHDSTVTAVVFSLDGTKVGTASWDKTARIWDATTGKELARFNHDDRVFGISLHPDGTKVGTASRDKTARIWDATTGKELARLNHEDWVIVTQFSPDGTRVITGSDDKTARIWDTATGQELVRLNHKDRLLAAGFSADGQKAVTAGLDQTARIWHTATGRELLRLNHDDRVESIRLSPDGTKVATASWDKTARIWDMATSNKLVRLMHSDGVKSAVFSPDGTKLITGSDDKTARIWDTTAGKELLRLNHEDWVESVDFSSDGSRVATGSRDKTARIWDAATGQELARVNHLDRVYDLEFSPDRTKLATASADKTARIWDVATGRELARFEHDDRVMALTFNPDGTRFATASWDKTARIWDVATGKELARFNHEGRIESVTFSPNSQQLLTGSDDRAARVWDIATNTELVRLSHEDQVTSARFSPDGTKVVTGSRDMTARVWNAATGEELARLIHRDWVTVVGFNRDGSKFMTASTDDTVQLWVLSSSDFADDICQRATRNLTATEWTRYMRAGLTQYELVCPNLPVHPSVLATGWDAVVKGRLDEALAIFKHAKSLQPDIDLDPTTPEIDRNPRTTVKTIAAAEKVKRGSELAKTGQIDDAIRLYQDAQKTIALSANQWNSLCWLGSLHGHAADVMFACDQAVSLDSSNQWIHKSRGISRAIAGDNPGAIEDLQIFVNSLDPNAQATAPEKQWIDQLRAGQNPFTDELLKNLLQG